jgi:hypothetical protein
MWVVSHGNHFSVFYLSKVDRYVEGKRPLCGEQSIYILRSKYGHIVAHVVHPTAGQSALAQSTNQQIHWRNTQSPEFYQGEL